MMEDQRSRTKVIWSLDRSFLNESHGRKVAGAGFDALRLLYSKGSGQAIASFLKGLKETSYTGHAPAIMVDVSQYDQTTLGAVRISPELQYEQTVVLSSSLNQGDFTIQCDNWEKTFVNDSLIYIGFGAVLLKTLSVGPTEVRAQVVQGGLVKEGMNIYVLDTLKEPTLFDLTGVDISIFKGMDVDYVILPGISTLRELGVIRKKLSMELQDDPWLICRVDNKRVCDNLAELLPHIDGVMISRRELALTLDPASIPMICKEIIQLCHEHAKLAIIESDMLSSMRYNATPTRAEVSDVANAVIDGTDAIVLAEDLALGPYAERSLKISRNIILDIENQEQVHLNWLRSDFQIANELDAVTYHAYKTAERVKAKAIVCITHQGNTALRLASYRVPTPIIAVTFSSKIQRRLSLVRGVNSIFLDISPALDDVLPVVREQLRKYRWLTMGDSIVFVTATLSSIGLEASNLLTVQKI